MLDTPVSLLERVQKRGLPGDWEHLVSIYTPLIRRWLLLDAALQSEADDLTQDVLSGVVQKLHDFVRRRAGSFRRWIRIITISRVKDYWRQRYREAPIADESLLLQLEDPASELSRRWDEEHDRHVVQSLLAIIEPEFTRKTWKAFTRSFFDELPAAVVAAELGVSANAVRLAKSRVLKRLRAVGRGLLD
jgi:RNA polymerase sigma-70 factor (ECF subfamily)